MELATESKKKCSPCAQNAALSYGDAMCHRLQKKGVKVNCHGLVDEVKRGRKSVDDYLDTLANVSPSDVEKKAFKELKRIMYEEGG